MATIYDNTLNPVIHKKQLYRINLWYITMAKKLLRETVI